MLMGRATTVSAASAGVGIAVFLGGAPTPSAAARVGLSIAETPML
jgi:hypothetical protein